jgi:hypothetical protein
MPSGLPSLKWRSVSLIPTTRSIGILHVLERIHRHDERFQWLDPVQRKLAMILKSGSFSSINFKANTVNAAQRMVGYGDVRAVLGQTFQIFFGDFKLDFKLVEYGVEKLNIFEMLVPVVHFVERRNLEYFHQKPASKSSENSAFFALMALATSLAVTRPMYCLFIEGEQR